MTTFVLRNANLLDLEQGKLVDGISVVVTDGKIIDVDRAIKTPASADAAYDLRGQTLMPGLIDCHVHCMASHINLGLTARMSNAIGIISALPIMKGMLTRGFTTVRDAGGADYSLAQASEAWMIDAPRIFPSGKALSQTGGHGDFRARSDQLETCACHFRIANIARVVDGVDDVRRAARDELTKGATQIKVMASGGVASPNDPIGNTGYSMDELRAIVAEADAWQTYVMAHAYTPKAIRRAVEAGVRTIEHGNLIDDASAKLMAEKGMFLVANLVTYYAMKDRAKQFGMIGESLAKNEIVLQGGLKSLEICKRHNIPVAYGSDLLGELHWDQSKEFTIRQEVVSPIEIIRSATTIGADVLRMPGRVGTLQAGAFSDVILVDGNPLKDLALLGDQGKHLSLIMKAGILHKNRLN
jgi:imidazolonepropionase-like amidohydrolase